MTDHTSKKRLPWCRVHDTWYTSRSHIDLSAVALNIGPRLISLANASSERGALLSVARKPLTVDVIARETRFAAKAVKAAMDELVACETLQIREDGAWWFPHFRRWQESPGAARTAAWRDRHDSVTDSVTCDVTCDAPGDDQRNRGQRNRGTEEDIKPSLTLEDTAGLPPAPPGPPPFASLVTRSGKAFAVTVDQLERWHKAYPAVDIEAQVQRMATWLDANPAKRPAKNAASFAVRWLSRQQDEAANAAAPRGRSSTKPTHQQALDAMAAWATNGQPDDEPPHGEIRRAPIARYAIAAAKRGPA